MHLNTKFDIDDINEADILIIPGSTATFLREIQNIKVLSWIIKINKTTKWTTAVGSVSIILSTTGILKDFDTTSHRKTLSLLAKFGDVPKAMRYVE